MNEPLLKYSVFILTHFGDTHTHKPIVNVCVWVDLLKEIETIARSASPAAQHVVSAHKHSNPHLQ